MLNMAEVLEVEALKNIAHHWIGDPCTDYILKRQLHLNFNTAV